jgi:hypothetical protein
MLSSSGDYFSCSAQFTITVMGGRVMSPIDKR